LFFKEKNRATPLVAAPCHTNLSDAAGTHLGIFWREMQKKISCEKSNK